MRFKVFRHYFFAFLIHLSRCVSTRTKKEEASNYRKRNSGRRISFLLPIYRLLGSALFDIRRLMKRKGFLLLMCSLSLALVFCVAIVLTQLGHLYAQLEFGQVFPDSLRSMVHPQRIRLDSSKDLSSASRMIEVNALVDAFNTSVEHQSLPPDGYVPYTISGLDTQSPMVLFCKLDFAQYSSNPASSPMFRHLVAASNCDAQSIAVPMHVVLAMPVVNPPTGFVFHQSRCGSTLVSNILGSVRRLVDYLHSGFLSLCSYLVFLLPCSSLTLFLIDSFCLRVLFLCPSCLPIRVPTTLCTASQSPLSASSSAWHAPRHRGSRTCVL
jgi:hypothetical protein